MQNKSIAMGLGAFFLLVSQLVAANPISFHGVQVPDSISVDQKTLSLNGMGLRTTPVFGKQTDLYTAFFYLEKKSNKKDEILKSTQLKTLIVTFLDTVPGPIIVD